MARPAQTTTEVTTTKRRGRPPGTANKVKRTYTRRTATATTPQWNTAALEELFSEIEYLVAATERATAELRGAYRVLNFNNKA